MTISIKWNSVQRPPVVKINNNNDKNRRPKEEKNNFETERFFWDLLNILDEMHTTVQYCTVSAIFKLHQKQNFRRANLIKQFIHYLWVSLHNSFLFKVRFFCQKYLFRRCCCSCRQCALKNDPLLFRKFFNYSPTNLRLS